MKILFLNLIFLLAASSLSAQNPLSDEPKRFISTGFVSPQFYGGNELIRAYELRNNGLSYFEDSNAERKAVGDYPANTGFSLSIGYYLPIKKLKGLSIGMLVSSGQTGSSPSLGGYEEGYFFNFVNFGAGFQYYPLTNLNVYVKGEFGMGSVFTKNRFINEANEQDFLHHFGIGTEVGGSLGYTFRPFQDKSLGINLEGQYQFYSTRVEVSGIGDDQWTFGSLQINVGLQF